MTDPTDTSPPTTAPADPTAVEGLVRAHVTALAMPGVEVIDCDPALADTAEFCAAYGYALADSANAIVVIGKSTPPAYVTALVLATHRLDVNGVVRRTLGTKKASFAPAADTVAITGMQIGGVTPFALPTDMPIWVDAAVMERQRIIVGGGSRACKVVGPPAMLSGLANVRVIADLAHPVDPEPVAGS